MPLKDEKPIQGLVSDKNFIKSNVVEAVTTGKTSSSSALASRFEIDKKFSDILAPRKLKSEMRYRDKTEYGKVPKYLEKAKSRINEEYEYLRSMHLAEQDHKSQSK